MPYLHVWGIVEHRRKELHTNGSCHLRFCSSASVVKSEDSWHYFEHLNWRCGPENSFSPSVKPPEWRGKVDARGLIVDSVFKVCLWCLWSFGTNNYLLISCYISKINPDSTKVSMPQANPCGNFMHLKPKDGLASTPTLRNIQPLFTQSFFSWKVCVLVRTAYSLKLE